jgi:hypothetical protein
MGFPAKLSRVHLHLSPLQWIVCLSISAVLAVLSGGVLLSRVESSQLVLPVSLYDRAERFVLDTIRLSFSNRKLIVRDENIYVAPVGLLRKDTVFVLLDGTGVYADRAENKSAPAIAPERVLDPSWNPVFSQAQTPQVNR